jgi:hypothetical protein
MASAYPDHIPSFTVKRDVVDINWANDINRLQDEISAIARELGTVPKGSFVSVAVRLGFLSNKADADHSHGTDYISTTLATTKGTVIAASGPGNFTGVPPGPSGSVLTGDPEQSAGVRWRVLGHGDLTGLTLDHHPQYYTAGRHNANNHAYILAQAAIEMLGNVSEATPSSGQFLGWTGSSWAPVSASNNHNTLSNLNSGHPHTQYPQRASESTITGSWTFAVRPTVVEEPVVSHADGGRRIFVRSGSPNSPVNGDIWIRP